MNAQENLELTPAYIETAPARPEISEVQLDLHRAGERLRPYEEIEAERLAAARAAVEAVAAPEVDRPEMTPRQRADVCGRLIYIIRGTEIGSDPDRPVAVPADLYSINTSRSDLELVG